MHTLSKQQREALLNQHLSGYPDGRACERIEEKIGATLPVFGELVDQLSSAEREALFADKVARERASFIAQHGDEFCCDMFCAAPITCASNKVVVLPTKVAVAA